MFLSRKVELDALLEQHDMLLVYLSHDNCQVCQVLKPKVKEMVGSEFPLMRMVEVDTVNASELAAQLSVFAVPTILLFAAGKEVRRFSRTLGLDELRVAIQRPYGIIFE